ncbi:transcriptional regulator [Acidovorax sp. CF316]|uniref:GntR family transcriptional regulator n=1 Tax=unclassified Acidovorax TaxID=2684926 RepID=UPI00026BCF2F|nr:GntR family transcriptional regulator [Acidovorax sp. CF316]EJE53330.1 transcriptional regulator [Acidovorax sp. CF316]
MKSNAALEIAPSGNVSPLIPKLAAQILEMVQREGLPKGYRLTEQALCDALDVSRSPVRKALQFLESTGVVTSNPNRGFQLAKESHEIKGLDLSEAGVSSEDTYMRIASDRIKGYIDQEVTEVELMSRYGLARPQMQRLLNTMAKDGLVDRKPGRGWVFRRMLTSLESHRESYRFRMMLEPAAILEPGYTVDLAELERCRREQQELLDGGIEQCTPAQLFQAGSHFHETVAAGSGNRFVVDALRNVNQMRRIVEYGTLLDRSRLHRQCEEHLQLIELLVRGERMEASLFLRQHLNTARITKLGSEE